MKRRITTLLGGGVLALTLFGVATAGPLEDGQAALQRGDYATAMRLLRPLAENQGDPTTIAPAQAALAAMYANGLVHRLNEAAPAAGAETVLWAA